MTWFRRSVHPEDELSAYVDGELGERARRAVETHLASCEACSTLLRELQDAKSLLSELPRLEARRSFALEPQFAVELRVAPKRMSFTFAPAVALTVLVALLFVDAVDFSSEDSSFDSAASTAGSTAASRQAESGSGGLALEAAKAPEAAPNADASTVGGATADSAAPAADDGKADAPAAGALTAPAPEEPEKPGETVVLESGDDENAAASAAQAPEDTDAGTVHVVGTEDSSDGLSTLRILEIAAAIALAASLLAVYLPRITGRREER